VTSDGVIDLRTESPESAYVRAEQPWVDQRIAAMYDAFDFDGDLPFYLELAGAQGGRVLEVACGTGRVVVPLARAGHRVVGIDVSSAMLELARAKLARFGAQAELIQADMRSFRLSRRGFDLAILAVKSFAYLLERADQSACLEAVHQHLRPGGLLAIDLLHPRPDFVAAPRGYLRDDLVQRQGSNGQIVSRIESVVSTDLAAQVRVIRSIYEVVDGDGKVVDKRFVEWPYRWTHRFEAEHLLERAGFTIEALYGGYRREPFTARSDVMLLLARKP
jgi:SAM-dependent methyltransferase